MFSKRKLVSHRYTRELRIVTITPTALKY